MASITIRNLDDETKHSLRLRAERNGRSMAEEVRTILQAAVKPEGSRKGLGTAINEMFRKVGGAELETFPRKPIGDPRAPE